MAGLLGLLPDFKATNHVGCMVVRAMRWFGIVRRGFGEEPGGFEAVAGVGKELLPERFVQLGSIRVRARMALRKRSRFISPRTADLAPEGGFAPSRKNALVLLAPPGLLREVHRVGIAEASRHGCLLDEMVSFLGWVGCREANSKLRDGGFRWAK